MHRGFRVASAFLAGVIVVGAAVPAAAVGDAKRKPKPKPKPRPPAVKQLTLAETQAALLTPEAAAAAAGYAGTLAPNPNGVNGCQPAKFIECQANWTGSDSAVPYPNYALVVATPDFMGGQAALGGRIGYWTQNGFAKFKESGDTWAGLYSAPDGSSASIVFGERRGANVVAGGCSVSPAPADTTPLKACATAVVDAQVARLPR